MIKLVECPRDAWQGLPKLIPAETKAQYLRMLMNAGFRHIDAASFVSSTAVPQMADAETVLASLDVPEGVELIGIVVNERGTQRAVATRRITTLGYPYSVSPTFLEKNQRQTPEESLAQLRAIRAVGADAGLGMVAYISMAFGNPYGDPWSIAQVMESCGVLAECGIAHLSLADTVGLATVDVVAELVGAVIGRHPEMEIGVHLHTKPAAAAALIRAAYDAGCRRFDGAIGGHGGCPFAQDDLVGNMPTEVLLRVLRELGADLPEVGSLDEILTMSGDLAREYGGHAR